MLYSESGLKIVNIIYVCTLLLTVIFTALAISITSRLNRQLQERVATAQADAEDSKLKAKELALQLEREKIKRLELEDAVSPRIMEQYNSSNVLKPFKVVTALITSIPDIEAQRTAGQIAFTLNMAGWKTQFTPYDPKEIFQDGVVVERNVGVLPEDDIAGEAAERLVNQLNINKIESRTMPSRDLPKNTVIVKVGFKPYRYFSDKKMEEVR